MEQRYRNRRVIGSGAQGTTFLASDASTGEQVVLKVVRLLSGDVGVKDIELWERECRVLATLDHPAIPTYREHFVSDLPDGDREFVLVQSYVHGEDLKKVMDSGRRWTEHEWLHIARQLLHILGYLHSLNPPVIHRDVKPSNVILQPNGRIALVDFGGVQAARTELDGGSTVVGTHGYMPPEQLVGRGVPASDLYGMAATLVHLASGVSPATMKMERMALQFRFLVYLRVELVDWLERLLAPMVEDRPSSAHEALLALDAAVVQTSSADARAAQGRAVALRDGSGRRRLVERVNWSLVVLFLAVGGYLAVFDERASVQEVMDQRSSSGALQSRLSGGGADRMISVPAKIDGSAGLKLRLRESRVTESADGAYLYALQGVVTWTGSGAYRPKAVYVGLWDASGEELIRYPLENTAHEATLRPGDSIDIDLREGYSPRKVARVEITFRGSQFAAPRQAGEIIQDVIWPAKRAWEGLSSAEIGVFPAATQFLLRGRVVSTAETPVGALEIALMQSGTERLRYDLDFAVSVRRTDGAIVCKSMGSASKAQLSSLEARDVRLTRWACEGLREGDVPIIEVLGVSAVAN